MKGFTIFGVFIASLITNTCYASDVNQAHKSPQACSKIIHDFKRLACYDKLFRLAVEPIARPVNTSSNTNVATDVEGVADTTNTVNENRTELSPPQLGVDEQAVSGRQVSTNQLNSSSDADAFGAESLKREADKRPSSISNVVTSIKKSKLGLRSISLANGQVWRETEKNRLRIAIDDTVVIKKGVFSSYHLTTGDSNRRARVKRIK